MVYVIKVVVVFDLGGIYVGYGYKIMWDYVKEVQFLEWGFYYVSKIKFCVFLIFICYFYLLGDEVEQKFVELWKIGELFGWFYCQNIKRMLMDKQVSG